MISNRIFSGKLNLDTHDYRVPPGDFVGALNITRDAQGAGQDLITSNIVGNTNVSYSLPAGTNKRIGSRQDAIRNRIYYFVYNSNSNDLILYYDKSTNTISKLLINLTDTSNVDVLNFDPSYKINHIDIIYRDEGDLLYWTDGLNRPFVLNVQDAIDGLYGTAWKLEYLTVNKVMPLIAPVCNYADDASVAINNLRKKLYQFRYRYVYSDFEKSCWSPIGKLFSPTDPDTIATDINPLKNNRIDVQVQTGDANCLKIEIAARQSITTTFSDFFLITTLNKADLSIPDNSLQTYQFFNDSSYAYVDINESLLLYSNVPKKAYTQALPNGNVVAYGATTEGYDFAETLDVSSQVTLISNSSSLGLTITQVNDSRYYSPPSASTGAVLFTFSGGLTGVTSVRINLADVGIGYTDTYLYTVNPGDTITTVITALNALIVFLGGFDSIMATDANNTVPADSLLAFSSVAGHGTTGSSVIITSSSSVTDINISAYKHKARYSFGLVYFDEFGETDGVQNQASSMNVLMPEVDTTGGTAMSIPNIKFTVTHKPPIWATSFAWVRTTNLTFLSSIGMVSISTVLDTANQYGYINITNLQTNKAGFSAYEFTEGDRVRILGLFVNGLPGTVSAATAIDFPISALVVNPAINGSTNSAIQNGSFLKIPYGSAISGFGTSNPNYYIEIYTPAPNIDKTQQVFFEFGENYTVLLPGTANRAHSGQQQDQIIGTQSAIYNFSRGDYYERKRLYNTIVDQSKFRTAFIMSQSVSDLYPSQVQSIGRPFLIDKDAKEIYFPTLIRFGEEFQQSTDINRTNIFFPENFDEYDRSNGDIRKLFIEGRYLYVFQKFDIGVVPILTQIVRDTAGNPLQANSEILLNKISYPYKGKYGIGDIPESFAYHSYAKYFIDNNKGVVCRLSQDGITELSVLYECNAFFVDKLRYFRKDLNNGIAATGSVYTGDPTVYGCFDFYTNKYIIALEEINRYEHLATPTAPSVGLMTGEPFNIGTFTYKVTFGGAGGLESEASVASSSILVSDFIHTVRLTSIPVSTNPLVTKRNIYRDDGSNNWLLAFTIANNTTVTIEDRLFPTIGGNPNPTNTLAFHQDPYTIIFSETRDTTEGFECFASYHPEGMESLGTLLTSFKDGALWTHDSDTYNQFYGVDYESNIVVVFNDHPTTKKSWQAIEESSNVVWDCPEITTQVNTYGSTPQASTLVAAEFTLLEGQYSSAIKRDSNSTGGKINGNFMKGNWMKVKFRVADASEFVFLNVISVKFVQSQLNPV